MNVSWRQICTIAAVAATVAVVLWSIRYSHSEVRSGSQTVPVRTNRFTGASEMFFPGRGWTTMRPSAERVQEAEPSPLPEDELAKLAILRMEHDGIGHVSGEVYNGSRYHLRRLKIRMTQKVGGKVVLSRALDAPVDIEPSYSGRFSDYGVDGVPSEGFAGRREFEIESARGIEKSLPADALESSPVTAADALSIESGEMSGDPPTVVELGKFFKEKYPGEFDDVSDAGVGRLARDTYPNEFGDVVDIPDSGETTDHPQTVADLGRMMQAIYPEYDYMKPVEVGRRVRAKFAPRYDAYVDTVADLGNFYIQRYPERYRDANSVELGRTYRAQNPERFRSVLDIQE